MRDKRNKVGTAGEHHLGKLERFARHLGNHQQHYQGAEREHLTLPELGSLVVVAGRTAGFLVKTESACGPKGRHRIDCAWCFSSGTPAVVWEFDARNVGHGHLHGAGGRRGTFRKLQEFRSAIKVQALYTIRGKVMEEQPHMRRLRERPQGPIGSNAIHIFTDSDLMLEQLRVLKQIVAAVGR